MWYERGGGQHRAHSARLSHRPSRKPRRTPAGRRSRPLVTQAEAPLSVEDLAEATNLHINTVRTHLDVFMPPAGPSGCKRSRRAGRPKWLHLRHRR